MSDPHEQGGISVTIKGDEPGGKYNDAKSPGTWIVFHGTPQKVKEQIVEVFDLPAASLERALYDLVNEATALFKAAANVSQGLGGTVLGNGATETPQPASGASTASQGDVWAQAAAAKAGATAEPATDPLLDAIEATTSVAELQQVWAENQAKFAEAKYMSAYKAKGKALTAA